MEGSGGGAGMFQVSSMRRIGLVALGDVARYRRVVLSSPHRLAHSREYP